MDAPDYRMKIIFYILVLSAFAQNSFAQRFFYPKLEKRAWEVFVNGDTIEMYCCQIGYVKVSRYKETYFYKGYLHSQIRYANDSTDRAFKLIRFNRNIKYRFRNKKFKRYFVLKDNYNNKTYWYRIISFNLDKSLNEFRFRLIKPEGERILSDPLYVPCCQ